MSTNEDAIDSAASISDRYRREPRPGRRPRPARLECAESRGGDGRDGEAMAGSPAGSGVRASLTKEGTKADEIAALVPEFVKTQK